MTPRRHQRQFRDVTERLRRVAWPLQASKPTAAASQPRVAVVSVNYNTAELIAHLLFSLFRVLSTGLVSRVVIVDNGSSDGSLELLGGLADSGLIDLVHNRRLPYHGPGLNRGLSFLATEQRSTTGPIDYVWILDSDTIVLRPDALSTALGALQRCGAAMAGQEQPYDQARPPLARYAHPSALLIDPRQVWRHSVPAFLEDGAPGVVMQHVLRKRGRRLVDFPFFADEYLLHLGSGTLGWLVRDQRVDNRYFSWALSHQAQHFHGNPRGPERLECFLGPFRAEVPQLTAAALATACAKPERVTV